MRYALIHSGSVVRFLELDAPVPVAEHKGYTLKVCPPVAPPVFNIATQVLEGPTYSIGVSSVSEEWNVRPKTAQELEADKDAELSKIVIAVLKGIHNINNRVRTLEGQATWTQSQFIAALRALL